MRKKKKKSYLKSAARNLLQSEWERDWAERDGKGKGKIYSSLNPTPSFGSKPTVLAAKRSTISAFIQLKTGIGYLQSYQFRIGKALSSRCFGNCHSRQDTKHLILSCPNYKKERGLLQKALKKEKLPVTLPILFSTSKGKVALAAFLAATGIGTAEWYREKGHKAQD